nr:S8 family serine peptidase [Acidobacteriota bacterium]
MRRLTFGVAVLAAVLTLPLAAGAGGPATDGAPTAGIDTGSAIVLLNGEPLSTYVKTKPAPGKKVDFSSNTVKSYRAQLSALRNDFKQWLRANAPNAKVTGEFDLSLNAVGVELNGESLTALRSAPMALGADYQGLYTPAADNDPDLRLISASQAWTAGGGTPSAKGAGVKVAIVDTGIDITHPCFSDGNAANDGRFTNDKVIVAKVFNNKSGVKGYTPQDVNGHGSHVAGTVACNEHTPASVDGIAIAYRPSGVAPAATLGNYNVFPGEDGDARSEDILDALEAAYEDGFNVANMSLGGGSSGARDLLAMGVDNLDRAGMVIAVAAGNSGPGFSTVESPGKAARALTAGASTVGHFIATPVTVGALTVGAASGDFATVTGSPLTAPLGVVTSATGPGGLSTACSGLPAGSLAGEIALISRGACTFSTKIRNAESAGAVATLVVNNVAGDPVAMASDGTPNQPTKPAYMVSLANRTALM